ncbi:MAG TPA: coproporphyrinogen III oxidase, partial [Thermoanaerobaculia bacterium]|nr:coproporphyrinogen III oxidase [Thermoanaerobaculia bacterium]
MTSETSSMRARMEQMVRQAQATICAALGPLDEVPFQEDSWQHPEGGGGVSRVLQEGSVFDKAGVNVAAVDGTLHE